MGTFRCVSVKLDSCAAPWLSAFVATGFIALAAIDSSVITTSNDVSSKNACHFVRPTSHPFMKPRDLLQQVPADPPGHAYRHDASSVYSRATFFWLLPIFRRLRRNREISQSPAAPPLPPTERCEVLLERLLRIRRTGAFGSPTWTLWQTCAAFCGKPFVIGGVLKLVGDATALAAPVGLAIVVAHAEKGAHGTVRTKDAVTYTMAVLRT